MERWGGADSGEGRGPPLLEGGPQLALDVRARQLTPFYEPILLFLFGQYFGAHTHTFCNS